MKRKSIKISLVAGLLLSSLYLRAQHDPQSEFKGKIGKTLEVSTPFRAPSIKAREGSPNVIWILLDDVGFGSSSTFGGQINTPTIQSLANEGLRFTNFHTTAMCSPTRASLLTGRNSHSAHMGLLTDAAIDFPGYDAKIPFEKGFASEILLENGYNTFAVGKWHITPHEDVTQAGPFNRWPTGRGFEHYFGFLQGETDQYHPMLWENTAKVEQEPKDKKHFATLITDKAIQYIADQKSAAPTKPFFLYYAAAAAHAPHQVDKVWLDKYKGKFDKGWDKYREEVLAKQKELGIVPKNSVLPARNNGIKPWDSLSVNEKKINARFMEAYAAFLEHQDYEIGRLVSYLKEINQLDNTLIFVIIGDNGASKEGDFDGLVTGELAALRGEKRANETLKDIDLIGTAYSSTNFPLGWAMANNTPFKYYKQDGNSEGGTRNPLVVFYPKGIKDKGGIRNQFTHVNSVLPTTLELIGATIPASIKGYKQEPLEGVSLAYAINDAKAPNKHNIQYFELRGSRAIYKDGWKAGAYHLAGKPFEEDNWELYNLNEDPTERVDLSSKNPDKLKELLMLFDKEAAKYNVYPIKDRFTSSAFAGINSPFYGRKKIVLYNGVSQFFGSTGPVLRNRSFALTAHAEINDIADEGVLFALGGRSNGVSLFVKDGRLQLANNLGTNIHYLVSDRIIPRGKVDLRWEFDYTSNEGSASFFAIDPNELKAPAGTQSLFINGERVAQSEITRVFGSIFAYDEGIDVGKDNNTPVADKYAVPFKFTGKLSDITIEFK